MARINKTKYALLGVLSVQSGSGYDIKKFCDISISHFWNENYGHIYPVLKQLEQEELVSKETETAVGKPVRYVFQITDKGRQALHQWLKTPTEDEPVRSEFLLKLFFARDLSAKDIVKKLNEYRKKHQSLLKKYQAIEAELQANEALRNHQGFPLWLMTLRNGLYHSRAMISWCDETIAVWNENSQQ